MGGVNLAQRAWQVGIDHAVLLPAAHADDLVANGELGVARFGDLAYRAATHGLAQRLGLGIAFGVVHATTHIRIQAEEVVAHQHLAVRQGRGLAHYQFEVTGNCFPHGPVV